MGLNFFARLVGGLAVQVPLSGQGSKAPNTHQPNNNCGSNSAGCVKAFRVSQFSLRASPDIMEVTDMIKGYYNNP